MSARASEGAQGFKLLVCDVDGTLVDHSHVLEPELADGLRLAQSRGLLVSIATGRMPPGVDRYRDELELSCPLIFYNGALVRDHVGGRDLHLDTLPRGVLGKVFEIFSAAPVHPLFYRDDRLYCLERSLPVRTYADAQGLRTEVVDDPGGFLAQGAFVKTLFIGHPGDLPLLRAELEAAVGPEARLVMTKRDYLELIPAAASKGRALGRLAEHLGIPLAEVVAAGDEENDLEMLRVAGLGIAMRESPEAVQRAAHRVAPPRADGGLLAALRAALPAHFA